MELVAQLLWFFWGVFTDDSEAWQKRRRIVAELGGATVCNDIWSVMCTLAWKLRCWSLRKACLLLNLGVDDRDNGQKTAIMETISLFGLLVGYALTLVVAEQKTTLPGWLSVVIYAVVSGVTWMGMICILVAEPNPAYRPGVVNKPVFGAFTYAYDRGSILFTRYMAIASLLGIGAMTALGCSEQLQGQAFDKRTDVTVGTPFVTKLKEEVTAIGVPVVLDKGQYKDGVPPNLYMVITLAPTVAERWTVSRVRGYVGHSSKNELMKPQPFLSQDSHEKHESVWVLNDLDKSKSYTFQIYLQPLDPKNVETKLATDLIQDKKGMQVTFLSRTK